MRVKTANGSARVNVTNQSLCRNIPAVARVEGISVQADLPQHYPLPHPLHITQESISIFCISQPRLALYLNCNISFFLNPLQPQYRIA